VHIKLHFAVWLIGCISGLSLVVTGATLNFWLAKEQISNTEVGLFSLVAIPYCINFIWSPILDRFRLPFLSSLLGHRLSWIFALQIILSLMIFLLSQTSPSANLAQIALLSVAIAFISSTKDNLLGAFRSDIISSQGQGVASGIYIFGYRIGMLLGNSGAIYLSTYLSWQQIYKIISIVVLIFPFLLIMLLKNHPRSQNEGVNFKFQNKFTNILKPIGSTKFIITILIFLILYRIADDFINTMINPFLLDLKFTAVEIATTGKLCGSIGAMIGGVLAGYVMHKLNIVQSLWYFGIIHTSAHILLAIQAVVGNNLTLYFVASVAESITGGMAMAAYIAFITSICRGQYKTTQQALFSSMMGLSRSIFPSISGFLASKYGWLTFFSSTFLLSIPALVLLFYMKNQFTNHIYKHDADIHLR
jgi:PAT family beta-lactamase induction signal transducer AmpG